MTHSTRIGQGGKSAKMTAIGLPARMPLDYLERHLAGDWGDLDEHDRQENELSLQHGWRLLSAYRLSDGTRIWIITEADRSSTCILLRFKY